MVKKFLKSINKSRTLGIAAFLISLSYLFSRVLGLVRDRLLASNFGISSQTDAYTAAFRIPDLLFTLLVSGAFTVAFIPIFIGYVERKKFDEAWKITSILLNLFIVFTLLIGVITFIFADPLVKIITPGFDQYRHDLCVNLTRIMLITPMLFGLSSLFGSLQQAFNRFLLFALASAFYNIGIIIGILFFAKFFVTQPIYGVAWGVVVGTLIQALAQIIGTFGLGFKYSFDFQFFHPGVKRVIKLMIPRSLNLGIDQLNYIVGTAIGSKLIAGSLTSYYFANNLKNVPMGLFGGAIATAAFPSLIRASKSKDKSKLPKRIVQNLRLIAFLVIPSAIFTIVMRGYIVRLLFGFGDPTTANILGWMAGAIVAQSMFFLIARVFYALEDTLTPLITSAISIVIFIIMSLILSMRFGVEGLGMALSVTGIFEFSILVMLLRKKIGPFGIRNMIAGMFRIFLASMAMGTVLYMVINRAFPLYKDDIGFVSIAPKFIVLSIIGLVIFIAFSHLLKIHEQHYLSLAIKRRVHKIFVR